jgi:hypothetical protein
MGLAVDLAVYFTAAVGLLAVVFLSIDGRRSR